jgi:hypothetical protein
VTRALAMLPVLKPLRGDRPERICAGMLEEDWAVLSAFRCAIGSVPKARILRASWWRFLAMARLTSGYLPKDMSFSLA